MTPTNRGLYRDGASTAVLNLLSKLQSVAAIGVGSLAGGLEGVGQIALVIGAAYLGYTIADFGFSSEVGRYVATNPSLNALDHVRSRTFVRLLAAGAVAPALLWLFSGGKDVLGPLAICGTSVYSIGLLASGVLSAASYGLGNFLRSSLITGLARLVASLLSVAVAFEWGSLLLCPIMFGMAELVIGGSLWTTARRMASKEGGAPTISRRHYWLGMASVTNTLVNQSDVLIVATLLTPTELGVFGIGSQLQNGVATLALSTTTPLSIYIARSVKSKANVSTRDFGMRDQTEARHLARQSLRLTGGLSLILTVTVAAGFLVYSAAFANDAFTSSSTLAVMLCIAAAVPSACSAVFLAIGVGTNNHEIVGKVRVLSGILALIFILTLAKFFGVIGAAAGTILRDLALLALTSATVNYSIWNGKSIRFLAPHRRDLAR